MTGIIQIRLFMSHFTKKVFFVMNDEKKEMKSYGFAFVMLLLPYILLHLNFSIGLYSGDAHFLFNVSMISNIVSLLLELKNLVSSLKGSWSRRSSINSNDLWDLSTFKFGDYFRDLASLIHEHMNLSGSTRSTSTVGLRSRCWIMSRAI